MQFFKVESPLTIYVGKSPHKNSPHPLKTKKLQPPSKIIFKNHKVSFP